MAPADLRPVLVSARHLVRVQRLSLAQAVVATGADVARRTAIFALLTARAPLALDQRGDDALALLGAVLAPAPAAPAPKAPAVDFRADGAVELLEEAELALEEARRIDAEDRAEQAAEAARAEAAQIEEQIGALGGRLAFGPGRDRRVGAVLLWLMAAEQEVLRLRALVSAWAPRASAPDLQLADENLGRAAGRIIWWAERLNNPATAHLVRRMRALLDVLEAQRPRLAA